MFANMFNHDIEVNFNLNRMGVAWFQQHSPKSTSQKGQKNTITHTVGANTTCSGSRNNSYNYQLPRRRIKQSTCCRNNSQTQRNQQPNSSVGYNIPKTPINIHQSTRLCQMPRSSHKDGDEETLELVDVIDIEDEDHSISAFFVGMNDNERSSFTKTNCNTQNIKVDFPSDHQISHTLIQDPAVFIPQNNSSFTLDTSKAIRRAMITKSTTLDNSNESCLTTATIINAVNTINISNTEGTPNLVNQH